jgi:hypothetical protein
MTESELKKTSKSAKEGETEEMIRFVQFVCQSPRFMRYPQPAVIPSVGNASCLYTSIMNNR